MKILFTGGGTAGHIAPIIAITREIKKMHAKDDIKFYFLGPKDKFSSDFLLKENIHKETILAGKIRRYWGFKSFFENIIDIFIKAPIGILQAFLYIFVLTPDVIFSKGGYGSLPAVISGWILRVPIFLHESDATPGLANKFLSFFASEVFISFPIKKGEPQPFKRVILVGNPIRKEILDGNPENAQKMFNLSGDKPLVLILGGSQGAQKINDTVIEILPYLLKEFEIIHQCGEKNFLQVKTESPIMVTEDLGKYYHIFPFLDEDEMKTAYAAAEIIVSRAGSGSIFEIASVGKPCILIPLSESAQEHQLKNAYIYAESGAGLVIEESNLAPHFFLDKLKFLIMRPEEMKNMQKAALEFAKPQASKTIAGYLLEYLK
ncbi:MAG: UDP-N-acetylglucosamine--N-acetylmuramyl-(pentapeptide) pyrophosphoryl-undecaprenol N-acetylglucosamine transferase [Candidatus Pacebacteria bacterium]|nr:UDP-N-acetylglucosamine--N-acetylmuramyl-(pentapeptide) pyrophosphoryl-undecaprenol N-acetylglucosamine transferase [Candidatus Paceibacterota bacterium]